MNFDEWYAQSPTRLTGPTAEEAKRAHRAWAQYEAMMAIGQRNVDKLNVSRHCPDCGLEWVMAQPAETFILCRCVNHHEWRVELEPYTP